MMPNQNYRATRHGNLAGQDKFATAFDLGRQFIDLRFKADNFFAIVVFAHGCHDKLNAWTERLNAACADRCYRLYRTTSTA